ncbi:hypothetical protein, partial [Pseudomonas sp.]|uniref:hypothetical protein n=1 Tax=Pseudomonas sp. TaxID=306 RepID=UPI003CC5027B
MKKLIQLLFLCILISACTKHSITPAIYSARQGVEVYSGEEVAARLTRRYNDTVTNCGSSVRPAFLCSGILFRGSGPALDFKPWDPSPTAIRVGGTSFSFVRRDYKMVRFAMYYTKGYVLYPVLDRPAGKFHEQILCFFPVDGNSDNRTDNGCGQLSSYLPSRYCSTLGITTGVQWAANYNGNPNNGNGSNVCSFDVRSASATPSANNFNEGMIGGRAISPAAFNKPNDVKIKTWTPGIGQTLPIEAFFYT